MLKVSPCEVPFHAVKMLQQVATGLRIPVNDGIIQQDIFIRPARLQERLRARDVVIHFFTCAQEERKCSASQVADSDDTSGLPVTLAADVANLKRRISVPPVSGMYT